MIDLLRAARPEAAAWLTARTLCDGDRLPAAWLAGGDLRGALFALFAPLLAPHDPLAQDLLLEQLPPSWAPGGDPAIFSAPTASAAICCPVSSTAPVSPSSSPSSRPSPPACRLRARPRRRLLRRLDRPHHLAPRRHLDVVSAGALVHPAGRRPRRRPQLGDPRHRRHRLDPLLPRRPRRDDAQRRIDYVDTPRIAAPPRRHHALAKSCPMCCRSIVALLSLEMGIAVIVEAILSFVSLSVSTDDPTWGGMIAEGRRHLPGLVAAGLPRSAVPHRLPSASSATA